MAEEDARALLDSVVPGRLDERVRDRIVAETCGNPLALLELPRGLTAAQAEMQAGAFETALKLLRGAEEGLADELHLARVSLLRAQLAFASGHDMTAPRLLLEAARRADQPTAGDRRRQRAAGRPPLGTAARCPRARPTAGRATSRG